MTPALAVLVVLLLAVPCHAGEIAYDLSPPLTSDVDSCGAKDAPLDDFDHYLVHLYRCVALKAIRGEVL